jgi:hypothetical protein
MLKKGGGGGGAKLYDDECLVSIIALYLSLSELTVCISLANTRELCFMHLL